MEIKLIREYPLIMGLCVRKLASAGVAISGMKVERTWLARPHPTAEASPQSGERDGGPDKSRM